MMHSVELKRTSVQRLKKDLEEMEKETETKLVEIDQAHTEIKVSCEFKSSLLVMFASVTWTTYSEISSEQCGNEYTHKGGKPLKSNHCVISVGNSDFRRQKVTFLCS